MSTFTIQDHLKTFEDQLVVTDTKVGKMVVYKNDTIVSTALALFGEYCDAEVQIMARYLTPESLFVDIGTNIGYHALAINKLAGCKVLGFEPHPNHFVVAALNCNDKEIQLMHSAVGNKNSNVLIQEFDPNSQGNFGGVSITTKNKSKIEVKMVKLDDISLPLCNVIKIDVEGSELDVLKGATNTINTFKPVILYEAIVLEEWVKCHKFLQDKKYKQYWVAVKSKPIEKPYKEVVEEDPFGNTGVVNILAVPEESAQPDDLIDVVAGEDYPAMMDRVTKYRLVF